MKENIEDPLSPEEIAARLGLGLFMVSPDV